MIEHNSTEINVLDERGLLVYKVDQLSPEIIQFTINTDHIEKEDLENLLDSIRSAFLTK